MTAKVPSYLRTYRRRSGLTQDEVAFLLGCKSGTKVSRYERLSRRPNLETAFACQALFGESPDRLFPGMYAEVEEQVKQRAVLLSDRIKAQSTGVLAKRKREILAGIGGREADRRSHS